MTIWENNPAIDGPCHKCGGLLLVERALDYYIPVSGMRCVNCGWCRRANPQPQHSDRALQRRHA